MTTQLPSRPATKSGGLNETVVRRLLDQTVAGKGLVAERGGKISRTHYAEQIGCTKGALTRFGDLFSEYEVKHGITTGPLRHLADMEKWFSAEYDAGRLDLRDDKIDRTAFQHRFQLRGGTFLTRHPPIRELIERFDDRAQREGYMPTSRRIEHDRFIQVLAGDLMLNKDRISINQKMLAEAAGLQLIRLLDKHFAGPLATRQAEITARVTSSKIDPFVHGRVFAFSDLADRWPIAFLERVGVRFKQVSAALAPQSVKGCYRQIFDCLAWIGASNGEHCMSVVAEAAAKGRITLADPWEEALFAYRAHLVDRASGSSVDTAIAQLRTVLDGLSSGGVAPQTSGRLPGVKHIHRKTSRLRSVAEVDLASSQGDDYVAFARARLQVSAKALALDLGRGEADEFISGLVEELRAPLKQPGEAAAVVLAVLERRLSALRDHATAMVERAMAAHERGRKYLASADIDADELERKYLSADTTEHERRMLTTKCFPRPESLNAEQAAVGVANLLALIDRRHGGIPPVAGTRRRGDYGQFFAKRYLAYGGIAAIEPMLMPDADAVGAVLALYLCESGANVSVGRTLDRACLEPSDLKSHHRITGHKARAKGKPIIVDLPSGSPVVRSISWLLAASSRLPAVAREDADRLMLMRIGDRIKLMPPDWFTKWFKAFACSAPGLSGLAITPNMIRPSVLLHAALSNDGRLGVGMALGQHGLAVTQGYQQKWPTRLIYDENVRRFQTAFETLILASVEDAASRLGITADQFDARLGDLRPTGLGTFCRNEKGRPETRGSGCTSLDCWNDCPHLLIVAEVDAIAQLRLWQASLRAVQPEWERDRSERWDAVWLPWLCLADVVQEKMARGPLMKIWDQAGARAETIAQQTGYLPPKPW